MTGGIGDRRIGDPEDVSPTPFSFAKPEIPIRDKTTVTEAGHMDQARSEGANEEKNPSGKLSTKS
jgi:hypothetical protein